MRLSALIKKTLFVIGCILFVPSCFALIKDYYASYLNRDRMVGIITLTGIDYDSQTITRQLQGLFKNNAIKGIMIQIDSSGGACGTAQTIFQEIEYLKKEYPKPIIACIENRCSAESYLIASATDTIIALPGALVGGITLSKPYEPALYENLYHQMITTIAYKRKLSLSTHELWAQGHLFTGEQALKMHLIDTLGSLTRALNSMKEKAMLEGDIQCIDLEKTFSLERLWTLFKKSVLS